MPKKSTVYYFYADYKTSKPLNCHQIPDWLTLETNWQGYRITTLPWIADVARLLGLLAIEDTPEAWIEYLESLGLRKVTPVCCEAFYEDKLYS